MNEKRIQDVLEDVAAGRVTPETAADLLKSMPSPELVNLGFARLDTGRTKRRGVAEAILCHRKTPEQVQQIVQAMDAAGENVLCTRVSPELAGHVLPYLPGGQYSEMGRVLYKKNTHTTTGHGTVAILTGGTSDMYVAEEAALCCELWGNEIERIYDVGVAGLHRLLGELDRVRAASVCIVAAGMEGALPSVVAGLTSNVIVAVPTSIGYGASFNGLAALLGMLNTCSGGVATVNIDNGFGAALLAHMINHTGLEHPDK